ncbi:histidine phosphatase family protein [Frondihabitans cladoniiphilus]|uniref:histidine phosphatase family protein n=1 Tax=Frondihabitans cladoniiphilus TaxID=715785 RepID=UPI0031E57718
MRILLVRHAQTTANAGGELSTVAPGPSLTALGREQADALASVFVDEHLQGRPLDGVYVSTLVRTTQTIEPLARLLDLPIVQLDGTHEIEAGDFEGSTDSESMAAYLAPIRRWAQGDLGATIPGAYDGTHFLARFDGSLAQVHATHGDDAVVVVVSHAGAMRVWLGGRTENLDPAFSAAHRLENTGVVELDGSPSDGWRVVRWQGEPIGGDALAEAVDSDPLGETVL